MRLRGAEMTRQDSAVPSPLVNLTEYWTQNQIDCISGFPQKMKSQIGISLLDETTAVKPEDRGVIS